MDANKIEILKRLYYANELPVPYNLKCGVQINIYPVKVKDWELFENSMGVLTIDKNGSTRYYDYGRYSNGTFGQKSDGNYRRVTVPNLKEENMQDYIDILSK
jgi:hypothetical protein